MPQVYMYILKSNRQTIVCRPRKSDASGIEIIAWFHDEDVRGGFPSFRLRFFGGRQS